MWIKGFDGFIETIGGIVLMSISLDAINRYVIELTQKEIEEDSGDMIANALRHAVHRMTPGSKNIAGVYLVANGVVKVFLAVGVLRGKFWCYPVAMIVITVFVLLQSLRLCFHFSWPMLLGTLIDVAIVLLIWREYRRHLARI
ncbi:MAG TPA: DUF2127 domain-containing protein [Candidatus Sulfotelmatobacter sp.]|nr:DUF2127 domain-containing protein [Candidatus Sulfotelmatobacter sp.]